MTPEEEKAMFEDLRKALDERSRISSIDNFINPPTSREVDAAIYDSMQDINSMEPQTSFTIEGIVAMTDGRWYRLLLLGAQVNIVQMLIHDWTAHGMDVDLGDGVALASKLSDYESLRSSLVDQFDKLLERLKVSSQRFSRLSHFNTTSKGENGSTYSRRRSKYNHMSRR